MKIYIFGNGNLSFETFQLEYINVIKPYLKNRKVHFLLCDFRGVDTLMMEFLKTETGSVSVYHVGDRPRYMPDKYKTKVHAWQLKGGYVNDVDRDHAAIDDCTHFLAIDINSSEKRKSGTLGNIERCQLLGKINLVFN